jgi:prevent-host-death family protein
MEAEMRVSVSEAAEHLSDLVSRAEGGETVVLVRDGREAVRLQPVADTQSATPIMPTAADLAERKNVLEGILSDMRKKGPIPGPDAAHSQDFLYDEDGLPR